MTKQKQNSNQSVGALSRAKLAFGGEYPYIRAKLQGIENTTNMYLSFNGKLLVTCFKARRNQIRCLIGPQRETNQKYAKRCQRWRTIT